PKAGFCKAITHTDATTAAYPTDAGLTAGTSHRLDAQRGASGKLRVAFEPPSQGISPESLPKGGTVRYGTDTITATSPRVPQRPGIWRFALAVGDAIRQVTDFNVITMLPFAAKKYGHVVLYFVGNWPAERGPTG